MRFVRLIAGFGLALGACLTFNPLDADAVEAPVTAVTKPLQFTSGGHVLGFTERRVVVATGSHALRVEFAGAREIEPVAEGAAVKNGRALPLGRVTYADLWEGITLAYDPPPGGLLRSTYTVAPGADPARIRLRYNAPVAVEPGGDLKIAYARGAMRESAPIAWQEIDGRRVPVTVAFRKVAEAEVGFQVGAYDKARPLTVDPTLTWHAFLGGDSDDSGNGIAVDAGGNAYVIGESGSTWGSPVRAFSGGEGYRDAFVAKLDGSGLLQWNTFLGGDGQDYGYGIAVDASGNAYVIGHSYSTWGSPVRAFRGVVGYGDAFVAKLNGSGVLQWNTFCGGDGYDAGHGIAVDPSGTAYVTGDSETTWGSPVREFSGLTDAFVSKLDSGGELQWITFLGGNSLDNGYGIAVDASGNSYVTGDSDSTWGSPVRAFSGAPDAFVVKLGGDGALQWNTFLGGNSHDHGLGVAVDAGDNAFIRGSSFATWGSPVRAFSGYTDAFVAKLDGSGALQWSTFLGGSDIELGNGIAADAGGNAFVSGTSWGTWSSPVQAFGGYADAFAAKLDGAGALQWSTFLGGTEKDWGEGIAVDAGGKACIAGKSFATWGNPISAYSGGDDAFVAVISGASWHDGEADLGGGWKWTDWFGYYSTASEPWIYHNEHRWLYPYDDGAGGVFFWYDDMQEFVWTEPATYPYLYRFGGSPGWLWYLKDSANPRWFYNYAAGAWEQLP